MLTRADLDAIEQRLTGRDPAAELALLRRQLAEAWTALDAAARQDVAPALARSARAVLAAHGHAPWEEEPRVPQ